MLVAMVVGSVACTTPPDWIQRTLVTVDVTGHWSGASLARAGGHGIVPEVSLDLQQEGPKIQGTVTAKGWRGVPFPRPYHGQYRGRRAQVRAGRWQG
jgi:hypothetical protein